MKTREQIIDWLKKSYLGNLEGLVPEEVMELVGEAFMLGTQIKISKELEEGYVQLMESLARAFAAGIKMGQVPDRSSMEDLEQIIKDNPEGLRK